MTSENARIKDTDSWDFLLGFFSPFTSSLPRIFDVRFFPVFAPICKIFDTHLGCCVRSFFNMYDWLGPLQRRPALNHLFVSREYVCFNKRLDYSLQHWETNEPNWNVVFANGLIDGAAHAALSHYSPPLLALIEINAVSGTSFSSMLSLII